MLTQVESVEISLSANAATIKLNTDKRYKILLKDYENLPFECAKGSPLENIIIDVEKAESTVTNRHFDGDTAAFLRFLSRKYTLYNAAMSKAAFTDMSKKSLYQKLYYGALKNKVPIEPTELKELCELVCDEFEDAGYVNDTRYALDKAKQLKEYKKYGKNKIKEYLYQKGVSKASIDEALEDEFFEDEDGDFENMLSLLNRKYRRSGIDKTDRNATAKAINLLSRNGYSYAQAKKAVTEFIESMEAEAEEE